MGSKQERRCQKMLKDVEVHMDIYTYTYMYIYIILYTYMYIHILHICDFSYSYIYTVYNYFMNQRISPLLQPRLFPQMYFVFAVLSPVKMLFILIRFHLYKNVQPLGKESKEKSTECDLLHGSLPLTAPWSTENNNLHYVPLSRKKPHAQIFLEARVTWKITQGVLLVLILVFWPNPALLIMLSFVGFFFSSFIYTLGSDPST